MIKKQLKLIIIIGITAVVLLCVYFFAVVPLVARLSQTDTEVPELLPGEVLGNNNRILLFEHVEKAGIAEIEVHNQYGTFAFYRGTDDEFYIRDNEGAPYDLSMLSSLVVSAGYTLSMTRVTTECEDWEEYGLSTYDNPAWYKLTTLDGTEHVVYIGDKIPTGAGYYVRYQDRDAVYVLDSSIGTTLLAKLTDLITPILAYPIGKTDAYTCRDFYIEHNGERTIWIDYVKKNDQTKYASSSIYQMKAPADYIPNSTNYETILQKFVQLTGTRTLEVGKAEDIMDTETLARYGLDKPEYVIHYNYSDIDNYVYVSSKNEDGTYYAYSLLFNLVAEVSGDTFDFLEWGLIKYVDRSLFSMNINDIAEIQIQGDKVSETFTLVGEGTEIQITPKSTGKTFDSDDLQNFRQLYKTILSLYLQDYTDSYATDDHIMSMRITTDAGQVYQYEFYAYSTRRCYYTVNGEGDFYVLRDIVDKVQNDIIRVLNGEPVDSWAKN